MKINRSLLFLIAIILQLQSIAQMTTKELNALISEGNEQKLVVHNSSLLKENYFYFADIITNKLLEINPESCNYNYRKGFILLEMRSDFEQALNYLQKATSKIDKQFDMFSSNEKAAPPDVFYHLGRAYHLNEEYDKAIENYKLFLKKSAKQSELIPEAKLRIKQCEVAENLITSPKNAIVQNLGEKINTKYGEYSPQISLDGKSLHITSRRAWENGESDEFRDPMYNDYTEDIYKLKLDNNDTWSSPQRLAISRPEIDETSVSVSIDERKIYLYEDSTGMGDIFITEFSNDQFNKATPVKPKGVNSNSWDTHLMVSPDGKLLFFVSDRPGGKGKRDIYYMEKKGGAWSAPINLAAINTEKDEDTPFMGLDNNILYFSNNGDKSMGGFDVFMTERDAKGNWSAPVNLGYPINGPGNDLFYSVTADGKHSYLSALRKGGYGEMDIYQVDFEKSTIKNVAFLNGKIVHSKGKKIPESSFVTLHCKNCENSKDEILLPRITDGGFFSKLEKCKEYELVYYYKENSPSPYRETFKTDCELGYQEVNKAVLLIEEKELIAKLFNYSLDGVVTSNNISEKTTKPVENVSVDIYDRNGKKVESLKTNIKGTFISSITNGLNYGDKLDFYAVVSAPKHITDTFEIKHLLKDDSTIHLAFEISTLKNIEKILALNPIYFSFDKSNIRRDAAAELDKVVEYLNQYPTLHVELGSHTDSRGPAMYNQLLSERRAISTANYLKKRISNPDRITFKGYGESRITNGCKNGVICSEEQHQLNRRTEFVIQK